MRALPVRLVLHFTFYALRFTFYALRFTPYVLRFTPYALRFTFYASLHPRKQMISDPQRIRHNRQRRIHRAA
jgi:hypothetical protein